MAVLSLLPLFKLAGVFGLIILLLRLSSHVGLALGAGAAALGLAFSMSPTDIVSGFSSVLIDSRTLLVALIVTLILILSASMERLGQMEDLLRRFKEWVRGRRWGIVAFPALIGLLPMPGGAVFSAPMLDSFDMKRQLDPSLKSFLNYWYRHIWEYWWPLYPGILLACAVAELNLWKYILVALPMTAVAMAGGFTQLIQVPPLVPDSTPENSPGGLPRASRALYPLMFAILPGVGFGIFLQFLGTTPGWALLPRETGLLAGLVAAIGWVWWDGGIQSHQVREILFDPKLRRMWLTLAGVFVFKGVMEQSAAAREIGDVLIHLKIPLEAMVVFIPMILGAMSGLPLAFVGAAFPIVVALIQALGASDLGLPLTILAYVSGFAGVLMSPVHLCLILSNEYFQASWPDVYRRLWLPTLIILVGGIGYFSVLNLLMR
jgi:integral membrane protein (TIGR00529 family)